jgi:hypothetical protein
MKPIEKTKTSPAYRVLVKRRLSGLDVTKPTYRVPFTTTRISVARGWVWGGFTPYGAKCDEPFFFFFFENIQTDLHSGTTTCRSTNITYTFHNMYLIFRVISNTAEYKYQCAAEHISITKLHLIHNCYQQQEPFTSLSI